MFAQQAGLGDGVTSAKQNGDGIPHEEIIFMDSANAIP